MKRYQVYCGEGLAAWLTARAANSRAAPASVPKQIALELDVWRELLAAELASTSWTLGEIGCIANVLTLPPPGTLLWAVLADAFAGVHGAYGQKWGVDEDGLVERARGLGPTACHALTSAVHAWRRAGATHTPDGWANVGVRVIAQ